MGNKAKIIAICTLIPIVILFALAIIFYYIITLAPDKLVDWTVNVSALKNVEDDNNRVIYVEYYSNKDGDGVELLDIKINGYIDANQIDNPDAITYSKGIQLVGKGYKSINFDTNSRYVHDSLSVLFGTQQITYTYVTPNVKAYFYDTQNNISFSSPEHLSADDIFKVSIGSGDSAELYFMKLLGEDSQTGTVSNAWWMSNISKIEYDENHLAKTLLDICRTNKIGLDSEGLLTVNLGDLFAYKKYNDGVISDKWLTSYDLKDDNIIVDFTNNVTIRIKTHSEGATKSSDSLFGIIEDKSDFEYIIDGVANDYFNGQQCLILNEYNFDCVNIVGYNYSLKFNEKTIAMLADEKYKDYYLTIIIDLDNLADNDINFVKFDDSIKNYEKRIESIKTQHFDESTNQYVYTGVTL